MAKKETRRLIDGKWYRITPTGRVGVELTHCCNTLTKAQMIARVLSALREATRYWLPKTKKLEEGRRKRPSGEWENNCEKCNKWFRLNDLEADHIIPCGGMNCFSKAQQWLERAFVEIEGYQRLCRTCHLKKGVSERKSSSDRINNPREESTYRNMMSRCYNPNATGYQYYGGKGVTICNEWKANFSNFFRDMGTRPEGMSLDRIDVNGNYCKENCRWASYLEQARNTTCNNYIAFNDEVLCVQEWAEKLGIKANTLLYRLRRGWSVEEALGFRERVKKNYNGRLTLEDIQDIINKIDKGETQTSCAREFGIDSSQICRIYNKFKKEKLK